VTKNASKVVARDGSGNFSAGTITAALSGNASTATNASNLGGKPAQDSPGINTIPTRDGSGYTYFNYINSNTGNSENPTVSQVIVTNGSDGFYRKSSIASFTSAVQSNASGTWSINVTGSAGSATTATTATNVAGGAAGNIHYQSGSGTTAFVTNGTSGQVLTSNGSGAPTWSSGGVSTGKSIALAMVFGY